MQLLTTKERVPLCGAFLSLHSVEKGGQTGFTIRSSANGSGNPLRKPPRPGLVLLWKRLDIHTASA